MDNLSIIESLRIRNEDYKEAIESKNSSISQLEKVNIVLIRIKLFYWKNIKTKKRSITWYWQTALGIRTCLQKNLIILINLSNQYWINKKRLKLNNFT